jgi:tetratricopeptide (TPR) repeat protein
MKSYIQQTNMREMAEEQAAALASVGGWLSTVTEKEEEMLKTRAQRRRVAATGAVDRSRSLKESPSDPIDELHEDGNAAMASGSYERAVGFFTRVLCSRPTSVPALANRSLAYLKMKDYISCIADATLALRYDPFHIKSWMRRASSRNALGQHQLASTDLAVAFAIEPTNKTIITEIRKTEEFKRSIQKRKPEVDIPLCAT